MKNIYNWVLKYKLYHIFFWATYHYFRWALYEGSVINAISSLSFPPFTIKFIFYVIFQALGVYFCLYYLIPKYLEKGKYALYIVFTLLTVLVMSLVILIGYYLGTSIYGYNVYEFYNLFPHSWFTIFKIYTLPSSLATMTLGMSIKLAKNHIESQKRQQTLEKEKLETELKFLKSQFNPHFLFNTINSIFVLINKNKDLATHSLAKFSELLRYQLYECNEAKIPLSKEIDYINSFIELEKLRQNENFELRYTVKPINSSNLTIAPFLLMPFIENAFKHLSQNEKDINWIDLKIKLQNNILLFNISNSISYEVQKKSQVIENDGGLGLKNVKRRLDLLYKNAFTININKTKTIYQVQLKLTLDSSNTKPKTNFND